MTKSCQLLLGKVTNHIWNSANKLPGTA